MSLFVDDIILYLEIPKEHTHTTIRIIKIKRVTIASFDEDIELLALLCTTGRDVK